MKDGYMQQVGTPEEIYDKPANIFVANFIGSPPMNFFNGSVKNEKILVGNEDIPLTTEQSEALKAYQNKEIIVGIRPESFKVNIDNPSQKSMKAIIENIEMLGDESILYANAKEAASQIAVKAQGKFKGVEKGDEINLDINLEEIHLFDKDTTMRII